MATKMIIPGITSGLATVYALIRNLSGDVWQTTTSTFVTWVSANRANYMIGLTEQGTSGVYAADFPAAAGVGFYGLTAYIGTGVDGDQYAGGESNFPYPNMADAIFDYPDGVETGVTLRQALRGIGGAIGSVTGAPANPVFFGFTGTQRMSAVADASGNRTVTFSL